MAEGGSTLRRSSSDRMIAGVVGGVARYFGMDATVARIAFVVLSIISVAFPGLLVYIILWVIMPADD